MTENRSVTIVLPKLPASKWLIGFLMIVGLIYAGMQLAPILIAQQTNNPTNNDPKPTPIPAKQVIPVAAAGAGIKTENSIATPSGSATPPRDKGEQEKIKIPDGTYVVSGVKIFSLKDYPKSFFVKKRGVYYTNFEITATTVSGTYKYNEEETFTTGGIGGFDVYFYKNGKQISNTPIKADGVNFNPKTADYSKGIRTGTFSAERDKTTYGADAMSIVIS